MSIITSWHSFVENVMLKFPETDRSTVLTHEGDMTTLINAVATSHELTFAEAAEVIIFRLPQFVEPELLSA